MSPATKRFFKRFMSLFNVNREEAVRPDAGSPAGFKGFERFFELKTNILERINKNIKRIIKTPVKTAMA